MGHFRGGRTVSGGEGQERRGREQKTKTKNTIKF